jgi:hypothetical protein
VRVLIRHVVDDEDEKRFRRTRSRSRRAWRATVPPGRVRARERQNVEEMRLRAAAVLVRDEVDVVPDAVFRTASSACSAVRSRSSAWRGSSGFVDHELSWTWSVTGSWVESDATVVRWSPPEEN